MNPSLIVTSLLLILALGALGGGIYWMIRRTSLLQSAHDAQAAAFERQMLAAMSVPAPTAAAARTAGMLRNAAAAPPATSAPPLVSRPETAGPGTQQGSGGRREAPLAASVIEKLGVAGVFQAVEGPLRTGNPDLHGTLVSLRGGKRIGILEGELNRGDPALQALLRHVDGLIIEGPGGEPLFLKRFQSFLSEFFTL